MSNSWGYIECNVLSLLSIKQSMEFLHQLGAEMIFIKYTLFGILSDFAYISAYM